MRKAYRIISIEAADIYRQEQENGGSVGYKMSESKSEAYFKLFKIYLDIDVKHRDMKIRDMTARIDSMYDVIAEIEEKIDDARYRKQEIEEKSLTFENIYRILVHFSKIYDKTYDEDRKELLAELIKEIHIYPEGENDYPLKSIKFAFPIVLDGKEIDEIFLNKPPSLETVVCFTRCDSN